MRSLGPSSVWFLPPSPPRGLRPCVPLGSLTPQALRCTECCRAHDARDPCDGHAYRQSQCLSAWPPTQSVRCLSFRSFVFWAGRGGGGFS